MSTAQQAYTMLGNQSLWDVAQQCHDVLLKSGIPHAIIGGVAVCLQGYQRNTVDLDLLVRTVDGQSIRAALESAGFVWSTEHAEFRSPQGIPVQLVMATQPAGPGSEVQLPDPADEQSVTIVEGLPVITLAKLIETKLACGQGNMRRTHRDFADVVELIARHGLGRDYARYLHKSLRVTYRKLVTHARGG